MPSHLKQYGCGAGIVRKHTPLPFEPGSDTGTINGYSGETYDQNEIVAMLLDKLPDAYLNILQQEALR